MTPVRAPTLLSTPGRQSPAASPLTSHKTGAGRIQAVLLGSSGVGKSALAQRILGWDAHCSMPLTPAALSPGAAVCTGAPQPTVGVDFATRSVCVDAGVPLRLHLWDTSGQERFRELSESYLGDLEDHDAVIAVYAASNAASLDTACEYIKRARQLAKGTPRVALVGAKADVEPHVVSEEEGRARAEELGAAVFLEVCCPAKLAEGSPLAAPSPVTLGAVTSRQTIEVQLLRPLLRKCLECAPPQGIAATPRPAAGQRFGVTGIPSCATPGKRQVSTTPQPLRTSESRRASPPPKAKSSALRCNALRRCLRLM